MTRDDIIRMAREAGYFLYDLTETHGIKTVETDEDDQWTQLERFATLVATDERQFIINFLESMHERCLGRHNYYLHAAKLISNLPSAKPTK